ncbi:MAG: UpxY family transcription antiterminator [Bacteroidales bacterium]
MGAKNEDILQWFVLKTIFSSELKVKALLDKRNIENFIPMHYKIRVIKGKKQKIFSPVIRDLVFVHATKREVEDFKARALISFGYKTYFLTRKDGHKRRIEVVQDKDMNEFMKVVSFLEEDITFYRPEEIKLYKGVRVRVIGGLFDGIEGTLLKIKGKRCKSIVLQIPGVAVATPHIQPDLIEIIKNTEEI